MIKLDNFKQMFSEQIIKIESEHLDYVNNIINISGHRLDKKGNNFDNSVSLSLEGLQEINIIAHTLYNLNKKGITSSNYGLKVKKYKNLCTKFFEEFGYSIRLGNAYGYETVPFSNPAELYERIDVILVLHKLDIENKKNFYLEFFNRERIPKQKKVYNQIIHEMNTQDKAMSEDGKMYGLLGALYIELPSDQQAAILNSDNNYSYDEEYYDILNRCNIKKIPQEVITYLKTMDTDYYTKMQQEQADDEEHFNKIIKLHNFLSYPACLHNEAEFLNQRLDTDIYV